MKKGPKVAVSLLLTVVTVAMTVWISPDNKYVIFGWIVIVSLMALSISSLLLKTRLAILIGLFVLIQLLIQYYTGFEVLNTFLLASVIIGIAFLLK